MQLGLDRFYCIVSEIKKTITSVLKTLTYIITCITAYAIGFADKLAIISVLTFITGVILYIAKFILIYYNMQFSYTFLGNFYFK